jgi:hypothetical protein
MSAGVLLLVLTAVLVVLLLVHRSDGDLGRAAGEYAVVAMLALLLASAPSTAGMTASLTSGVTSGSQLGAGLVAKAWRATLGREAAAPAGPPETTRPARRSGRPPEASGQRPKATSPPAPGQASPLAPARQQPPTPAGPGGLVLLAVAVVLGLLVLAARRVRRADLRRADELALPLLPSGRRRRRGRRVA